MPRATGGVKPSLQRLIFLRHGETDWNKQDRFQGQTDVPLNARGRQQAEVGAARLAEVLAEAESLRVVSSDLSRARDTAEAVVSGALGAVPVLEDPDLREIHGGDWEGQLLAELEQAFPAAYHRWRVEPEIDAGPVGGESVRATGERVVTAVARHAGADADVETLLVVSHGTAIRGAVGLLTGATGAEFAELPRVGNVRAVVLERGSGGWEIRGYNV